MLQRLRKACKNFVLSSDLLATPTTLRCGKASQYSTMCGGLFSILLMLAFMGIFALSFIDILNKVVITASTQTNNDPFGTFIVNDTKFGVGIQGVDFREMKRYFEIVVTHESKPLGGTPTHTGVEMIQCDKSVWIEEGGQFQKLFEIHQMEKMLCPKKGEHIQLEGFKGTEVFQFIEIKVQKCVNRTGVDWTCHSQEEIDAFIKGYQNDHDYLSLNVFVQDTRFSPLSSTYLEKVLEDEIFLSFSSETGSRGTIKIGDYNITTDQSIWPVEESTEEFGHYIVDYSTHTISLHSTHYVKLIIEKDHTVYIIQRGHGKLDDMLSYAGGLFSLLFVFIAFFVSSYSEYKYEIAVAETAFSLDQNGRKARPKDFGFLTYLKYVVYDWLKTFGCTPDWEAMQSIDSAREEATQQMDVRLIIKKLERLETINRILMKERNIVCAQLTQPPTIDRIKKLRKITQYSDRIIQELESREGSNKVGDKNSVMSIDQLEFPQDFEQEDKQLERQIAMHYFQFLSQPNEKMSPNELVKRIPNSIKERLNQVRNIPQNSPSCNLSENIKLNDVKIQSIDQNS